MLRTLLCTLLLFLAPLSNAALDERIVVVIEEPAQGEYYSGISNLRGYAVSPEGTGRYYHKVYIDGDFAFYITPYGKRTDVGFAFPDYPDSDTGGFSMAFNYKNLSPGEHEIKVRAYDDAGNYNDAFTTFTAERFETEFISSDSDVDITTTETWSKFDKQTYLVKGATLEGKQWDFLLRWDRASQSFKMEGILPSDYDDTAGSTDSSESGASGSSSGTTSGSTNSSDSEDCPGPGYDCWYNNTDGSSGDSGTDTTTGGNTSGTDDSSSSSSGSSGSGGGSGSSSGSSDSGGGSGSSGSEPACEDVSGIWLGYMDGEVQLSGGGYYFNDYYYLPRTFLIQQSGCNVTITIDTEGYLPMSGSVSGNTITLSGQPMSKSFFEQELEDFLYTNGLLGTVTAASITLQGVGTFYDGPGNLDGPRIFMQYAIRARGSVATSQGNVSFEYRDDGKGNIYP